MFPHRLGCRVRFDRLSNPDAASEHQHPAGLRKRERRRAELHPEPQSVPVHFPQGARAAHRKAAQPQGDADGGGWRFPSGYKHVFLLFF